MKDKIKINIKSNNYIIGICTSMIFTFITLMILAFIIAYTSVPESIENTAITVINSISIFIGSFIVTKEHKSKGIIKGALYSLLYISTIYMISSIISLDFSLSMSSYIFIIIGIIMGMIGGIVGVNIK